MLLSMTGYGKGSADFQGKKIKTEIRSLNSKLTDIRIKVSVNLGEKEMALRKLVHERAMRGKIELTITFNGTVEEEAGDLNTAVITRYFDTLSQFAQDMQVSNDAVFQSVLRLPNVIMPESRDVDRELWHAIVHAVEEALENLKAFRRNEGQSLEKDLNQHARNILDLLSQIEEHEQDRKAYMRDRLKQKVEEFLNTEQIDKNRFEQEIAFYLDKTDINEEKVRLKQHCEHFLDALANHEVLKGRKLNFISQEMGREINTLGSKAQWSPMQKIVVEMKTCLDKIKEQVANTL